MKVFRNIGEVSRDNNTVISIGTFDGVHLAHRLIINKVLELSKSGDARSLIITFDPHPQEVLKSKSPEIKLLTTTDEKLEFFNELGVQNVLIINFTEEFSKTSARDFYEKIVFAKLGISNLVIGYDHMFGRNREGNYNTLTKLSEEFKFKLTRVNEFDIDGVPVSSTRIRNYLAAGEIQKANSLLGYDYSFDGIVIEGDKVGRQIGYPTVNIKPVSYNKLLPDDGVYCVKINCGNQQFYGMMYIGYRPTLSEGTRKAIEVNIFDFESNIYGEKLTINFLTKLRNDIKFNSKEELIKQIGQDKEQSLKFINNKINTEKVTR
ncbi:MAG: bifunctional riboflavin kinase/FAD synthetase [Ignavibacteria bacterium]